MGGLNPGSGAALRKVLLPGAGTAWWRGTAGGSTDARARAADEQTMQEAQVGQSPSGNAATSVSPRRNSTVLSTIAIGGNARATFLRGRAGFPAGLDRSGMRLVTG